MTTYEQVITGYNIKYTVSAEGGTLPLPTVQGGRRSPDVVILEFTSPYNGKVEQKEQGEIKKTKQTTNNSFPHL